MVGPGFLHGIKHVVVVRQGNDAVRGSPLVEGGQLRGLLLGGLGEEKGREGGRERK